MANLMDIYFKVGSTLANQDFDTQSVEQKKKLVNESLKKYLAGKIAEESTKRALELSTNETISVDDLVDMLGEIIPIEEHFDSIRHLTHFMLNIAGEMQGWAITWYSTDEPEYIDNPLIEFNDEGKIDSLTSHPQTSYVQTFKFVNEIFKNEFMTAKKPAKQLEK